MYTSLGPHRAGSSGDVATAAWLRASLPPAWAVETEPVRVAPYFEYAGCTLQVDGASYDCFGVWLPNATAVRGRRVASGGGSGGGRSASSLAGLIAVVDVASVSLGSHGAGESILDAISRGAAAVAVGPTALCVCCVEIKRRANVSG